MYWIVRAGALTGNVHFVVVLLRSASGSIMMRLVIVTLQTPECDLVIMWFHYCITLVSVPPFPFPPPHSLMLPSPASHSSGRGRTVGDQRQAGAAAGGVVPSQGPRRGDGRVQPAAFCPHPAQQVEGQFGLAGVSDSITQDTHIHLSISIPLDRHTFRFFIELFLTAQYPFIDLI